MNPAYFFQRLDLRTTRPTRSVHFRPRVEPLETRELPAAMLFVVPGNVPTDATHFYTLSNAIGAAAAGDTIQIEPNSAPGRADGVPGTNTVSKALTIQGDPADGPHNLPQVGELVISASGVTLKNLNLSSVELANGLSNTTVANSFVAAVDGEAGTGTGSSNVLIGNTVTFEVTLGDLNSSGDTGDQVLNNTFLNAELSLFYQVSALVQGNTFAGTGPVGPGGTALFVNGGESLTIANNIFTVPADGAAIYVGPPPFPNGRSGAIRDNAIDTDGQGTGIVFQKSAGQGLSWEVEGNDLVRNLVGVRVIGDGTSGNNAFGTIDLGGGALGSPGANDFHGYDAVNGHLAVITANGGTATTAMVSAHNNIFSVADPSTVSQEQQGMVDFGIRGAARLFPDAAFVADLYRDYLKRTGSFNEWFGWVQLLPSMGRAGVAAALIRSTEASMRRVDGLYLKILSRPADPTGEAGWANVLHNGGTEEQVAAALLASPEFGQRANSLADFPASPNTNYVEALYRLVLGRAASGAEIDFWVAQLLATSRSVLARSFLNSAELRQNVVKSLYFTDPANQAMPLPGLSPNLLHRSAAPPAADLAAWSNTGLDLLSIEVAFAGTGEFYANG
jgi:hypothetical protein